MNRTLNKICTKCKQEKELADFYKDNNYSDGMSAWCKKCKTEYAKQYRLKNKDKIQRYRDIHLEDMKQYRELYREEIKEGHVKRKEKRKQYRLENKDKIRISIKKYKTKNKHKLNKSVNNYRKQRRKTDVNFKILCNLRNRLYFTIKHNTKSASTKELLGCTVKFLKRYLEARFTEGMTWSNYGTGYNGKGLKEWHIDHIRPCASFDLSKESEQRKCFHYSNSQPLWAKDNWNKSDSILQN